jgi:hypothetical protein
MRLPGLVVAAALAAGPALAQGSVGAPAPAATTTVPPAAHKFAPMNLRTTGDLLALCNTPDTDPAYPNAVGLCVGYGSGVLDYHLADTVRNRRARKVCIPKPPPTRGEARTAFIAWAQANPQYMTDPAVQGAMRFFIATYPCRK